MLPEEGQRLNSPSPLAAAAAAAAACLAEDHLEPSCLEEGTVRQETMSLYQDRLQMSPVTMMQWCNIRGTPSLQRWGMFEDS